MEEPHRLIGSTFMRPSFAKEEYSGRPLVQAISPK
jgi:hypothetical protein